MKTILLNKTKVWTRSIPLPRGEYVEVHEQKKKALNCNHSILKGNSSQKFLSLKFWVCRRRKFWGAGFEAIKNTTRHYFHKRWDPVQADHLQNVANSPDATSWSDNLKHYHLSTLELFPVSSPARSKELQKTDKAGFVYWPKLQWGHLPGDTVTCPCGLLVSISLREPLGGERKLLAHRRSGALPRGTRCASLKAVGNWNLMQRLHLASTLKVCAPAEPVLLVNPHPKVRSNPSAEASHTGNQCF